MIVFAGPSLAGKSVSRYPEIDFRGPAKQGDVYLATLDNPSTIGLIDGYFEGVPSVWHKEILWALSKGIQVLGSASMGALRAAELCDYGMVGIGAIYDAYQKNELEDDDEVALVHGPEEVDFLPLSIAMVNVRATCKFAVANNTISTEQHDHLVTVAKSIFYKVRTWQSIFAVVDENAFGKSDTARLSAWFPENEVNQKQIDAFSLLDHMTCDKTFETEHRTRRDFRFENTELWQSNVVRWTRQENEQRTEPNDKNGKDGYRLLSDDQLYR